MYRTLIDNVKLLNTHYADDNANIKNPADRQLVQETIDYIIHSQEPAECLTFPHYNKTITFLSGLIKEKKNDENLPQIKQSFQTWGNELVQQQYILPTGQMPNASLLVGFYCPSTNSNYVILIENGKFKEYGSPAGKIDKKDIAFREDNTVDISGTYINAALREFVEEVLAPAYWSEFKTLINKHKPKCADRDALGIPEFNKDFDTRLLTLYLGTVESTCIKEMLKPRNEANVDSVEAFMVDIKKLDYNNPELQKEAAGKFINYFLTQAGKTLKIRPTVLVTLNGTDTEPGFANFMREKRNREALRANSLLNNKAGSIQPQLESAESDLNNISSGVLSQSWR